MQVLITSRLPEDVIQPIAVNHPITMNPKAMPMPTAELKHRIGDSDALLCTITDQIDAELLDSAPRLRMIANYGVGYDHIDMAAATARGIPVSNTPGVLTDATAEITLALMLATSRRVVEGDARVRAGQFQFWSPFHFLGTQLSGKTLGIIGMGRIGRAVAQRAIGFDMSILYYNRHRLDAALETETRAAYCPLPDLLAQSDIISVHVPLTQDTHHLIDATSLTAMKSTAVLINTARGPVVDEMALAAALKDGRIAGAGLDVYENEPALMPGLAELPNTVLLPHVGSATQETRRRMGEMAVANLLAGMAGQRPPNCLNPEVLPADARQGGDLP